MVLRAAVIALVTLAPSVFAPSSASAQSVEQATVELLRVGWPNGPNAMADADALLTEYAARGVQGAELEHAKALVFLKHRRYDEASEILAQLLRSNPQNYAARRTRLWIAMLRKKYDVALLESEALAESLAEADHDAVEIEQENAVFLGRAYGYLEGPAAGAVAADRLNDHAEVLRDQLTDAGDEAFERGLQQVVRQFVELDLTAQQAKAEAKESQEDEKKRQRVELREQQAEIDEELGSLAEQSVRIQQDFATRLARIDRQLAPIQAWIARLQAILLATTEQINIIDAEIARVLILLEGEDRGTVDATMSQVRRLEFMRNQHAARRLAVQAEGSALVAQRNPLLAERNTLINQQRAMAAKIRSRETVLNRRDRQVKRDSSRAARPATGSNAAVTAKNSQVAAFTTYLPFPFEQEKHRLLESLD